MGHSWTGEISNFDTKLLQGRPGNLDHFYLVTIIFAICLFFNLFIGSYFGVRRDKQRILSEN